MEVNVFFFVQTEHIHPKSVAEQKWNEDLKLYFCTIFWLRFVDLIPSFFSSIHQAKGDFEVAALKHKFIGKDKVVGVARIPIPDHGKVIHEW